MNANTRELHDRGQSVWVDNISREMLVKGTLARYIDDWSVTGLTSNPTIFEHAISHGDCYDEGISRQARRGGSAEDAFFELALEDLKAAAEAYLRGMERRLNAGLDPKVASVASLFAGRWDVAVRDAVAPELRDRLGIAIATQAYKACRELLASARWHRRAQAGARPQRLLWARTGSKDRAAPDTLYVDSLAAPDTINTIPEKTLFAFADHGRVGAPLPADGGNAEAVLAEFARAGVDVMALAARLQREGADAFVRSWRTLLARILEKCDSLASEVVGRQPR